MTSNETPPPNALEYPMREVIRIIEGAKLREQERTQLCRALMICMMVSDEQQLEQLAYLANYSQRVGALPFADTTYEPGLLSGLLKRLGSQYGDESLEGPPPITG